MALAFGQLPHTLHYNQTRMRGHLYRCLVKETITTFPHKKIVNLSKPVARIEELPVFWICRMPVVQLRMVECTGAWNGIMSAVKLFLMTQSKKVWWHGYAAIALTYIANYSSIFVLLNLETVLLCKWHHILLCGSLLSIAILYVL